MGTSACLALAFRQVVLIILHYQWLQIQHNPLPFVSGDAHRPRTHPWISAHSFRTRVPSLLRTPPPLNMARNVAAPATCAPTFVVRSKVVESRFTSRIEGPCIGMWQDAHVSMWRESEQVVTQ